jgi:chaperone modulatory protein CbpM
MITLSAVIASTSGLQQQDLERWIVENWVRPEQSGGDYLFHDVDVARVQLILDLRDQLDLDEFAIPVVLSLLDQVYDLRRRMRQLGEALAEIAPHDVQRALAEHLAQRWRMRRSRSG